MKNTTPPISISQFMLPKLEQEQQAGHELDPHHRHYRYRYATAPHLENISGAARPPGARQQPRRISQSTDVLQTL